MKMLCSCTDCVKRDTPQRKIFWLLHASFVLYPLTSLQDVFNVLFREKRMCIVAASLVLDATAWMAIAQL